MKLIPVKVPIHCPLCDPLCDKEKQEKGGILEGSSGQFIYVCDHCFKVLQRLENGQPPILRAK